jgi:hypothetical protein
MTYARFGKPSCGIQSPLWNIPGPLLCEGACDSRTSVGEGASMKSKKGLKTSQSESFAAGVGRALRRAAKDAQKTARMYGTPLYVWENGKVVAKKP